MPPDYIDEKLFKAHLDSIIQSVELKLQNVYTRLASMDREIVAKATDTERRLLTLNELRKEVIEDRGVLVTVDVFHAQIDRLNGMLTNFERRLTIIETRAITWTAAIGVFFVILQIALRFWKP
jgi:hypothetical protein